MKYAGLRVAASLRGRAEAHLQLCLLVFLCFAAGKLGNKRHGETSAEFVTAVFVFIPTVTAIFSSSRSEHSGSAACTAHLIPGKKPLLGLCFYLQTPIFEDSFAIRNKVSIRSVTLTLAVQVPAGADALPLWMEAGTESGSRSFSLHAK